MNRKEGLLIDLSLKPDVWGDYIVKSAKASCKVGYGLSLIHILLVGREGFTAYQIRINSECWNTKSWSEPAGAKVRGREGKNPDHRLRSRMDS